MRRFRAKMIVTEGRFFCWHHIFYPDTELPMFWPGNSTRLSLYRPWCSRHLGLPLWGTRPFVHGKLQHVVGRFASKIVFGGFRDAAGASGFSSEISLYSSIGLDYPVKFPGRNRKFLGRRTAHSYTKPHGKNGGGEAPHLFQ